MAAVSKLEGPFARKCTVPNTYEYNAKYTSNNTSSPTAISPTGASTGGGGETIARTGVGTIEITFPAKSKPEVMYFGQVEVLGDEPNLFAKVVSYTQSTGKLLIKMYTNSAGTIAAADTTSKVYQVHCTFTRNA
jgi:hypothetical protein